MQPTMRAAVATAFNAPLEVQLVSVPSPGAGQVLVRVLACGVCHTDLHAVRGDWPVKPTLPLIPGHEVVGEVTELGEDVDDLALGDRVGVPWLHSACGRCEHCLGGWETLCESQRHTGYDVDGGWAEYLLADAKYVARVPSALEPLLAAPLICAGVTVYKGLVMTDARAGDWVAVSGIGGLGHLAVQYARAMGFRVVAVDVDEAKLDLAASLGVALTVNAREVDVGRYLQRQLGGTHGVLVTAASPPAFAQAVKIVRSGGTVVLNGMPPDDLSLSIFEVVMRAITLRGSIVGTRHDMTKALALATQQDIRPTIHAARLEDINDVLSRLESWPVPGRMVLDLDPPQGP